MLHVALPSEVLCSSWNETRKQLWQRAQGDDVEAKDQVMVSLAGCSRHLEGRRFCIWFGLLLVDLRPFLTPSYIQDCIATTLIGHLRWVEMNLRYRKSIDSKTSLKDLAIVMFYPPQKHAQVARKSVHISFFNNFWKWVAGANFHLFIHLSFNSIHRH